MNIIVKNNILTFNNKEYQCAFGKAGFTDNKIEGDNKTPIGTFLLREVFYRDNEPKTESTNHKNHKKYGLVRRARGCELQ